MTLPRHSILLNPYTNFGTETKWKKNRWCWVGSILRINKKHALNIFPKTMDDIGCDGCLAQNQT